MIGRQYKAHKDNVIDLYSAYKIKRGDLDDGNDIKFLESRIQALKNNKFILAVAGEVKAGKSTFINALLGKEILPSDVLQATSAIVEIFKSETSHLKIRYADGKEEVIYDDLETHDVDEAKERLHAISKIHDEFREIPTTLLDQCILESKEVLTIDDAFISQLEQQSSASLVNKKSLIEQYIAERTKDKIPVKIEFGYPLQWEFDELRIVDSPGVNATGGVQDVSFRYFEAANAILFVHPIKPIESESFRKFVNSVISNRSKETLFLILTHAGLYANDEVERLHAEAGRLYKSMMPENRILAVDSVLKLIHCDLEKGVSVQDIRKTDHKKKLLSSYREQAEDENRELIDVVCESSRFKKMIRTIDEFSMKAPNLQLQEILEKIKAGYDEQESQYDGKIDVLEKKKRSPQEFEQEINRINEALEKYKLLTKQTKDDLISNYSGIHSSWHKDIEALKDTYSKLITGSDRIESARKHTADALGALQAKIDNLSRDLTQKLEEILQATGKAFKEEHQISIPRVDLRALEEETKRQAYTTKDVFGERDIDGWDIITLGLARIFRENTVIVGTQTIFDHGKHLREYKTKCKEEFYNIANNLPNKFKEALGIYLELFSKEMDSVIGDRQKALEAEKEKKSSNEQIITEIKDLDRKKKDIQSQKIRCVEVLEDIR